MGEKAFKVSNLVFEKLKFEKPYMIFNIINQKVTRKMSKKIRGEKRKEIYNMIERAKTISLKEIKASTNINYNTIRSALIGLINSGLIERIERGVYKPKFE